MIRRKIVHIDESKCDGCGLCVPACEEGAIRIVDGKARLVSDVYCDGLGACLGHCPQSAILVIERAADPFDEAAVAQHLAAAQPEPAASSGGCPGAVAMQLRLNVPAARNAHSPEQNNGDSLESSGLANWPVQLQLIPPQAPYLQEADVLLVADCVPFACRDFHGRFLDGRPVVVGCPKLDDGQFYVQKLAQMIQLSGLKSLSVLHMEVPCCTGLLRIAEAAVGLSGRDIPVQSVIISLRGDVAEPKASSGLAIL